MLSTVDLERLITVKRLEIEKEKTRLGLVSVRSDDEKENETATAKPHVTEGKGQQNAVEEEGQIEDIPPDLERYIRRYLGLPAMLRAGEYSPNNPLVRGELPGGDALCGLGEYERRRDTLRRMRQRQYREYLDQQAKKKQEEKEQAERARREQEEREREREEQERERLERARFSPERPRAYTNTVFVPVTEGYGSKVDTGVQTVSVGRSLSVAVQTDDAELYRNACPPSPPWATTRAERELSPRSVPDSNPRPRRSAGDLQEPILRERRKSEFEPRRCRPSILDADAVHTRNAQAEQEAAAKRQFYQQELRNQIQEQQRIREERKAREKMLEQAEMRRLEEQLRMLRTAQERELGRQCLVTDKMRENATDYEKKRTALQKEIDREQHALLRIKRPPHTSHSDSLPLRPANTHKPFSTNIPANSIFSPNYDVDSYLRKNLNPSRESLLHNRLHTSNSEQSLSSKYLNARFPNNDDKVYKTTEKIKNYSPDKETGYNDRLDDIEKRVVIEKAIVHDRPRRYEPSKRNENDYPIPVLRHSPVITKPNIEDRELSDAMKVVDDKWKVPVVQKNILKNLPNKEGKNVNILTQLGSIRRQLQLEQLKLDEMSTKDDV